MKKFLILLTLFSLSVNFNNTIFADGVKVTATVWAINNAPLLNRIIPSYSPVVVKQNTIQSFSMFVKDKEWGPVTYTITSNSWEGAVNVTSWTLSNADRLKNWQALIYFKYLAPVWFTWSTKITVTLNDSTIVTPLDIDLYIY